VTAGWSAQDFLKVTKAIRKYTYETAIDQAYLENLRSFLLEKRDCLVGLLENPVLVEHESFTDLLRAVFHLTEELAFRENLSQMPDADRRHIAADIKRAYGLLRGSMAGPHETSEGQLPLSLFPCDEGEPIPSGAFPHRHKLRMASIRRKKDPLRRENDGSAKLPSGNQEIRNRGL